MLALARANSIRGHFAEAEAALAAIEPKSPTTPPRWPISSSASACSSGAWATPTRRARCSTARGVVRRRAWRHGCSRCACRSPSPPICRRDRTRPRPRSATRDLDAETGRLLETRLAMALFYAGRWTEARALARRHLPAIPIRDYTGLMTLPAYRIAAVESGTEWPGARAPSSPASSPTASAATTTRPRRRPQSGSPSGSPRRALPRRRALAVGGRAALRARGRLRPGRRRAHAADRDRRPHR